MKKLIAVGTDKPNPKFWHSWDEVRLHIADSIEEAKKLDGRYNRQASEVDMSESGFVLGMPDLPDD